jgi:hypothetical protein
MKTRRVSGPLRLPLLRHTLPPLVSAMFVPRAVRLKGVKETTRPKIAKVPAKPQVSKDEANKDALVEAMSETSVNSPIPQQEAASDTPAPTRGPRFTTKPATPEYISQLAAGIELIFTDYAHQEKERSKWLKDRYRVVDGEESCKLSPRYSSSSQLMSSRHSSHCDPGTHQHLEAEARSHPNSA